MNVPAQFRFGAFTLCPGRRELLFHGRPVGIGSRAFDLLVALVEQPGRLASRDALMARVWGRLVVDDNNLAAQVSALRRILAADPSLSRCLQADPGRGYRFTADVQVDAGPPDGAASVVAAAVTAEGAHSQTLLSLVVMPFASLGIDPAQAQFAQGLSHTIATDLSRISGLTVIASATAASLDGRHLDARAVSQELAVRHVLTGSVQQGGRRLRINAQLVDGQTGLQVWSDLFDGDAQDPFALQDRITGCIANAIGREVFVAAARDVGPQTVDPTAFELLMRGIAADNRPQSLATLQEQEALFAGAVEREPANVDALARLSRAILLQVTQAHADAPVDAQRLQRGIAAAEAAVALEPGNARAHFAVGLVHVLHADFERSALANEAAIALDRNFALAHNNLANSLLHLGRGEPALAAIETALRLDPRGPQVGAFWTTRGFVHLLLRTLPDAVACFERAQVANPKLPRARVGAAIALALSGDDAGARRACVELLALVPRYRLSRTMDGCSETSPPAYRQFYAAMLEPGAVRARITL